MRQRDVVALVALNPFPPEGHAGRTPAPDTPAPDEALLARVTRTPREKAQPRSGDSRRWRHPVALTAGVLGVGISALAAAAAGVLPEPISHVFPWAAGGSGSTVVQAHRLTSLPGPFGTRLEFWVTTDSDGRQCLNHVLVDADAPASSSLETALGYTAGGECGSPLREPGPEPDAFLCSGGGTGTVVYTCTAGRVTRAEVRLDDGGTLPATVVDGWVVGWLQTEYGRTATIVGYDDEGTVVARRSVHAAR